MKTIELKQTFELKKDCVDQNYRNLLELYLVKNMRKEKIARDLHLSIPSVTHLIAKASFELRKASNDPEYLKAKQILYGN